MPNWRRYAKKRARWQAGSYYSNFSSSKKSEPNGCGTGFTVAMVALIMIILGLAGCFH